MFLQIDDYSAQYTNFLQYVYPDKNMLLRKSRDTEYI
jgi:hypothetical protein